MSRLLTLLVVLVVAPTDVLANGSEEQSCLTRTAAAFADYEVAKITAERPTVIAVGDYDSDGKPDVAVLLEPRSGSGNYALSVCLSARPNRAPELIRNVYTKGPISTKRKGTKYYDFNTEREGVYERDGINSYCCDCCGATYVLRGERFEEVVDAD